VELLVVIAIIGILVALLLPAVQAAREAARRSQCKNKLKQIGLACLEHESAHGSLPSGGWSKEWTADPNRGFGPDQPGSWEYNILPYLEEQPLHDMGKGLASPALDEELGRMISTPVEAFYCPSRRPADVYPHVWLTAYNLRTLSRFPNISKSDYAANTGDSALTCGDAPFTIPRSYAEVDAGFGWSDTEVPGQFYQTGVIHYRSEIELRRITDGTSKTYLVGEKYLNPISYQNPNVTELATIDYGDNQGVFTGFEWDNQRRVGSDENDPGWPPMADNLQIVNWYAFGSAHPGGFHVVMCDGSVLTINYDIALETHWRLGVRFDGEPIDENSL